MGFFAKLLGGGIIGDLIGIGGDWVKSKRQVIETTRQAQIQYLQTEQGARHAWNIASIQASGKNMRWASFIMWSTPMVWAFIDPPSAEQAFNQALAAMPDWYVQGFLAMTAGIWGLKEIMTLRNTTKSRSAEEKMLDKVIRG